MMAIMPHIVKATRLRNACVVSVSIFENPYKLLSGGLVQWWWTRGKANTRAKPPSVGGLTVTPYATTQRRRLKVQRG